MAQGLTFETLFGEPETEGGLTYEQLFEKPPPAGQAARGVAAGFIEGLLRPIVAGTQLQAIAGRTLAAAGVPLAAEYAAEREAMARLFGEGPSQLLGVAPETRAGFWTGDAPRAIGQIPGFLIPGGLASKGLQALGMGARGAGFAAAALVGAGMEGPAAYYEAKAEGASDPEAMLALFAGVGVTGPTEALGGLANILTRGGVAGKAINVLLTGLEEGSQELVQRGLSDIFAKVIYESDRPFLEGALREFGAGSIAGGLAELMLQALPGRQITPGAAPGTPAPAAEAPGTAVEAPGAPVEEGAPEPSPERVAARQAALERYGGRIREEVSEVPEAEVDEPGRWARAFVGERGGDVVLVRPKGPVRLPAMFDPETGSVVLDVRAGPAEQRRAIVFHEATHLLKQQSGVEWEQLFEEVKRADPIGLAEAEADYRARWSAATGEVLTAEALREEGLGRYSETLSGWVEALAKNPSRIEQLVERAESRSLVVRLVEALKRLLSRVTGGRVQTAAAELDALLGPLRGPAGMSRPQALQASKAIRRALDLMVGRELPALRPPAERPSVLEAERLVAPARESPAPVEAPAPATLPRAPETRPQPEAPPAVSPLTPAQRRRAEQKARRLRGRAAALRAAPAATSEEARAQLREAARLEAQAMKETRGAVTRRPLESRQAMAERLYEEGREEPPRFAAAPPTPLGFFSQLERTLDQKIQGRSATSDQVRALLDPAKGNVKAEEVEWSGIREFLRGKEKVSKADLLQFVRENNVRVEEVVRGEPADLDALKRRGREIHDWMEDLFARYGQSGRSYVEAAANAPPDVQAQFRALAAEERELRRRREEEGEKPLHAQYQLPGGENYREVVLTLPGGRADSDLEAAHEAHEAARAEESRVRSEARRPVFERWAPEIEEANRRSRDTSLPESARAKFRSVRDDAERSRDMEAEDAAERSVQRHPTVTEARDRAFAALKQAEQRRSQAMFTGGHYPEPNVLAHVRFNERTDAKGRRVLFIEEVQSDWHQQGRKKGYRTNFEPLKTRIREAARKDPAVDMAEVEWAMSELQREPMSDQNPNAERAWTILVRATGATPEVDLNEFHDIRDRGVPDAPFKATWHELALRRMVRWGAEHGFDAVAWTTGAQQVERYETAFRQVVDRVVWTTRVGPSTKFQTAGPSVAAFKDGALKLDVDFDEQGVAFGGNEAHAAEVRGKTIEDIFGKEIARRILSEPSGTIEQEGLTIGGKGMQGFYDQMLPAAANKIGKRFGAKVETARIPARGAVVEMREPEGWQVQGPRGEFFGHFASEEAARAAAATPVHALPITPEMRATVMEQGLPMFAVAPQQPDGTHSFTVPDQTQARRWFEGLVNRMERLAAHEKAAPVKGGEPVQAEKLLPGRMAAEIEKLNRKADRIVRSVAAAGGTLEQLNEYRNVSHAPARNAAIQRKDPSRDPETSPGSGIKTSDALARKARLDALPHAAVLQRAAERLNKIRDERLDRLEASGNLSAEERKAWEDTYGPTYVPMRTMDDPEETYLQSGGYNVRGPESRKAKGRSTEAENTVAQEILQADQAIRRAHTNQVGRELGKLVRANLEPDVWQEFETAADIPASAIRDGLVFTYKENGADRFVVLHDKPFAESMRELTVRHGLEAVNFVQRVATVYKKLHTAWNISFIAPNLARDYMTASVHLTAEQGRDFTQAALNPKNVGAAAKGMLAALRDPDGTSGGGWGRYAREFIAAGGKTSWVDRPAWRKRLASMERAMKDESATPARRAALWFGGWVKLLEQTSDAAENAVRLSVYKAARDRGMSEPKAAVLGKEVTVNFNQKGRWSSLLGTMYLFFNPGVQGTARIAKLFANPQSRPMATKISAGIFATGAAMSLLNYLLGGEDDDGNNYWDKTPFYQRERNAVWLVPGTEGFKVTPPLPWGYNVLYGMGSGLVRMLMGSESPARTSAQIGSSAFAAFSPIAGEANLAQMVSPWFLDPFVQQAQNTTWYGQPIQPPPNPFDRTPIPASMNYWPSVSPAAKAASSFMARMTGGTAVEPGLVEVSPEVLEHWAKFLGGGAGAEAVRTQNVLTRLISGEEVPLQTVPVVRRFLSGTDESYVREDYFEALKAIELEYEKHKAGLPFERKMLAARPISAQIEKRIKLYRQRRDQAATAEERKSWQDRIDAAMRALKRRLKEVTA